MNKKIILLFFCLLCSITISSQASGGQIRRPHKKVQRKNANSAKASNSRVSNKEYKSTLERDSFEIALTAEDSAEVLAQLEDNVPDNVLENAFDNFLSQKVAFANDYNKALSLRRNGKGKEALAIFSELIQSNDNDYSSIAEYQIGLIYYYGLGGIAQTYYNAFLYFRMASDKGCKEAMYYLGLCYEHGRGTAQNIPFAKDYYRKSGYTSVPSMD